MHCRRDALKLLRLYEIYFQLDDLSLWDFNWRKVFHILLTAVLRALGFVYFSCTFLAFACSELCMMALCVCFCACEKRKIVADKIFNSSTLSLRTRKWKTRWSEDLCKYKFPLEIPSYSMSCIKRSFRAYFLSLIEKSSSQNENAA